MEFCNAGRPPGRRSGRLCPFSFPATSLVREGRGRETPHVALSGASTSFIWLRPKESSDQLAGRLD